MIPHLEINSLCISCDNCYLVCPENSVIKKNNEYSIEIWSCTLCQVCVEVCPLDCIKMITESNKKKMF